MDHAVPVPFPRLPREEALARAAELDAALHRSMRERGELLIDPKHLERAARAANRCPACANAVSSRENLAIRMEAGVHVAYHPGCAP